MKLSSTNGLVTFNVPDEKPERRRKVMFAVTPIQKSKPKKLAGTPGPKSLSDMFKF